MLSKYFTVGVAVCAASALTALGAAPALAAQGDLEFDANGGVKSVGVTITNNTDADIYCEFLGVATGTTAINTNELAFGTLDNEDYPHAFATGATEFSFADVAPGTYDLHIFCEQANGSGTEIWGSPLLIPPTWPIPPATVTVTETATPPTEDNCFGSLCF